MPTRTVKKNTARNRPSVAVKRTSVSGSGRRVSRGPEAKAARDVKTVIASRLASAAMAHALKREQMPVDEKHVAAVRSFEAGLQLERRQNYRKALEIFKKLVAEGPADVADRARVHLRACAERAGTKAVAPRTVGDYHVMGVAELNRRDLDRAVEYLSKARKLQPKREEIRYALAAAHALRGDHEEALEHLAAAIALRPQNRFQARHDADFQPLAGNPRFVSLVSFHGGAHGGYRSGL
jgi:tetratricopeptide (TPR) repeat protein